MRVLVTGGAGFIGSHVADALVAAGHEVVVYDMLLTAAHPYYPAGAPDYLRHRLITGDIRDAAELAPAMAAVDAVCHQAAKVGLGSGTADLPDYASHNDLGTATVLAAADRAGVGRVVLASSMVIYGEGRYDCAEHGRVRPPPRATADLDAGVFEPRCPHCRRELTPGTVNEVETPDPRNAYAASKLASEHFAASWARSTGGAATALRYHNVYGARMPRNTPYSGVGAIFRSALERGEPVRVFEDGGQLRDFVDVRDVAAANLAALLRPAAAGEIRAYNICSGTPHTVGEMASELAEAFGGPAPLVTGEYRLGDVRHILASGNRARDELGAHAAIDFATGMRDFATAALR